MKKVYLLIGGNLSDRSLLIKRAGHLIERRIGRVLEQSSVYETEPWGFDSNELFLNKVLLVETSLQPSELLETILKIEKDLGRKRVLNGYESRLIDIDILFYDDQVITNPNLVIPHPRIQERMFTLKPLQEINGAFIHPVLKKSIQQLVTECPDGLKVMRYNGK